MSGVTSAQARLEERRRAERRLHRRALLRRTGWVLAAIAPFAVTAWVLLGSSWLVVERVQVKGESRVSEAAVLAAAGIDLGTPLARIDTGGVARRVRALGPVADVVVSRAWPDTVRVSVVERQPVVGVGAGTTWTLYDGTGTQLGTATALAPALPRLEVARPGPRDPSTRAALRVLVGLPTALRARVAAVRASSPEAVQLVLRDGRQVVWGGTSDGRRKAAAVVALLRLKGRVFDVSSPEVVTRR